jgi:hypothetical protein
MQGLQGGLGHGFAWRGDVGMAVLACMCVVWSGERLKEGEGLSGGARRALAQAHERATGRGADRAAPQSREGGASEARASGARCR